MSYAMYLPMLMQMMQQQGGQQGGQGGGMPPFGMNYFNPQGGSPYSSQQGMLGGAMGGGFSPSGKMTDIAGGLFNLFGGAKNPSNSAMPYLDQMGGKIDQYMDPFIQSGNQMRPMLQDQYKQMISNPGGVMNHIGEGFQQSPGYQFQVNQAQNASNRAASAGGMLGSPMQQQNIAGTVNNLANQDYYNYLDHGMNMYGQGMQGASHMNDLSFGASSQAMNAFMQQLMAQAQNAYAGANTSNQQNMGGIGSLIQGFSL